MDALLGYDEAMADWDAALGLEVHVELNTASKMWCGCSTGAGEAPNTQTCPVCLGLPGSLPVVNGTAVESAIRIGLAPEDGLPVGFQVMAPPLADDRVYRVGAALERRLRDRDRGVLTDRIAARWTGAEEA